MPASTFSRTLGCAIALGGILAASSAGAQESIHRYAQVLRAARVQAGSETIFYSYDAKGRLVGVARSGSINDGVTTAYQYDRADNRTRLTTTGSPNPPQP